jgi:hypothetical protein
MIMKSGLDLSREGAAMLPELYPDRAQWPAARRRLRKRYRSMIDSGDPALMNVGFFLFGLAEAMNGRGRHGA